MGALYKRGNVWWCKYYANGRPSRESTGCAGEKGAGQILKACGDGPADPSAG